MKPKKKLGIGWSILLLSLVITLIELCIPKGTQGVFLFFAIMTWNVWVVSAHLVPFIRRKKQQRDLKKQKAEEAKITKESRRPIVLVMMLHVNLRITEKLHDIYPEATWAWCQKNPETIVLSGGIGRICVNGIENYEYADVKIELNGNISLSMVKQMPELIAPKKAEGQGTATPPMNPQIWYEQQGRTVLQNVITDLHSRGYATLMIREDGSILIQDNEETVPHGSLADFPAKSYWKQLVQVLQRDGLSAKIEPTGLQLTW